MGWNDHIENELCNLPEEAFENAFNADGPFVPNDIWLKQAEPEHQVIAMREWGFWHVIAIQQLRLPIFREKAAISTSMGGLTRHLRSCMGDLLE